MLPAGGVPTRRIVSILSVLLASTLLASCGSSSSSSVCADLATDAVLPVPASGPGTWNVEYSIDVTPPAVVTSLQYRDMAGVMQTVTNPSPTWSVSFTGVPSGTRVTLVVAASAPPGTVYATVVAESNAGGAYERHVFQDGCGQ